MQNDEKPWVHPTHGRASTPHTGIGWEFRPRDSRADDADLFHHRPEQWVFGAEARGAALAAGRSDWQQVTGWPQHLEDNLTRARERIEEIKRELERAERQELRALTALMAKDAVRKDTMGLEG